MHGHGLPSRNPPSGLSLPLKVNTLGVVFGFSFQSQFQVGGFYFNSPPPHSLNLRKCVHTHYVGEGLQYLLTGHVFVYLKLLPKIQSGFWKNFKLHSHVQINCMLSG